MKTNFAIAAWFSAAVFLTPAYATPVLFTATTTLPATGTNSLSVALPLNDTAGSITATGYDSVFSTAKPPATVNVNSAASEDVVVTSHGLGLDSNDAPYIGPGDAVLLDFANVKTTDTNAGKTGTASQISFSLNVDITGPSDWVVYGMSNATGTGAATLLASGPMSPSGDFTVSTSPLYSSYLVGVTNDCALTINEVYVQYSGETTPTPEPGTFVMAGMALAGIGLARKRRTRKA